MSDIFDKIGKAAQRVVSNVSSEVSIAALEQKVTEAYRDLGRQYYETVQRGGEPTGAAFDAHMRRLSDLLVQIAD